MFILGSAVKEYMYYGVGHGLSSPNKKWVAEIFFLKNAIFKDKKIMVYLNENKSNSGIYQEQCKILELKVDDDIAVRNGGAVINWESNDQFIIILKSLNDNQRILFKITYNKKNEILHLIRF